MKKVYLSILAVICLSLLSIQCSQDSNPVGPGVSAETQSGDAVLSGNFDASGTNSIDFSLIQVSIRGANIQTSPDSQGDFQINGVPIGNQTVEVNVENSMSTFDVSDIQSGEEIRMQLQIQSNLSVMLQNMYRNKKSAETLQLEIRPKKWNIDWENSTDEGHVRIYGAGFDTITSVVITGPPSSTYPTGMVIPNFGPEIGGVYCKAFFNQSDAIAAIPDPVRGDIHEITVAVTHGTGTKTMSYPIEIVGAKSEPEDPEEPEEDLVMDIKPDKWNTNWTKSNGYVTVRFRGEGFDEIIVGATSMNYNGGPSISPHQDGIYGSSYAAKFYKKDAIALFSNPQKGEVYSVDVTVQFADSTTLTVPYTVSIVGPNK